MSSAPVMWSMSLDESQQEETCKDPPLHLLIYTHVQHHPALPLLFLGCTFHLLNITALGFASLKVHLSEGKPAHAEG